MLLFNISQTSVDAVTEHIENIKQRIMVGIRLGMRDGIRGLAQAEVQATSGHTKSGELARILASSGKVFETADQIVAVYRPRNAGKQPHYWLEYGTHVPEVSGPLMAMNIGGEQLFRRGHRAFDVPARPFFFTTAEAYKARFLEAVSARVDEAVRA